MLSQVAAPTKQDAIEWAEIIKETAESASHREEENRKKERAMRIARELSNLVVYCQSVVFNNDRSDFYCHCLYLPIRNVYSCTNASFIAEFSQAFAEKK